MRFYVFNLFNRIKSFRRKRPCVLAVISPTKHDYENCIIGIGYSASEGVSLHKGILRPFRLNFHDILLNLPEKYPIDENLSHYGIVITSDFSFLFFMNPTNKIKIISLI